jgi:hypothetical protein
MERRMCAERTRAALKVKRDRTLPVGGRAPIGWSIMGKKKKAVYVVNLEERELCKEIARRLETMGSERLYFAWPELRYRGRRPGPSTLREIRNRVKAGFPLPNGSLIAGRPNVLRDEASL